MSERLRDKKTGQYVSLKKATEIEPNKIIDIWLKEEPKEQKKEEFIWFDWFINYILKITAIMFLFVATGYLVVRI